MYLVLPALTLGLLAGALADMITIEATRVKHLPKMAWIIIVILIPLVGGILWFLVGREYLPRADRSGGAVHRPWAQPGHSRNHPSDLSVRDAEAELAALDREIAEHERAERIRRLEAELEEKRRKKGFGA